MASSTSPKVLSHTQLERMVHYYHFLSERVMENPADTFTSEAIARIIHMDPTLVRKDFAAIGVRGQPRVGFHSAPALQVIHDILGFREATNAVIVGAGRLGGALATYNGFARYGLRIVGVFDSDAARIGAGLSGVTIQSVESMARFIQKKRIPLAIITVPANAAQEVADIVVAGGVKAIWNFASATVRAPEHVCIRHEHISAGFAELSSHIHGPCALERQPRKGDPRTQESDSQ